MLITQTSFSASSPPASRDHLPRSEPSAAAESCGDVSSEATMISRRKILSRSRDELNVDFTVEDEEDVWYQKEKLFKRIEEDVLGARASRPIPVSEIVVSTALPEKNSCDHEKGGCKRVSSRNRGQAASACYGESSSTRERRHPALDKTTPGGSRRTAECHAAVGARDAATKEKPLGGTSIGGE
ncbi:hypothetical protein V5799_008741 [Amblyomma americanum]|uniref:Uncharacterized protein n=1 Tax=Amblyomma americanum TaxID=6943 RepID=A0AAQ4FC58_AMBAM